MHIETMEETKDKGAKSNQDGSAEGLGMAGRKQPQWISVQNIFNVKEYTLSICDRCYVTAIEHAGV